MKVLRKFSPPSTRPGGGHVRKGARLALLGATLAAAVFPGCSSALIEQVSVPPAAANDRLTLRGEICTKPPDPTGFPVKVVLVTDLSGSMCISDPPGSQEGSGFCERADVQAIIPPGVTEPARVRALKRLIAQFRTQPNVQVSLVPFETNVKNPWPPPNGMEAGRFAPPNDDLVTRVNALQSQLGKGTDYQGALAYAYSVIASDIARVSDAAPDQLPRTRYVVVFLTDGTPYPRCSGNDMLTQYADPDHPELTWADSIPEFCNLTDPRDQINGFVVGTDRNQNYQLFSYVDQIMELKEQYNVGDIRFHSVLLFNEEAVRACGPICQDVYGTYPGVAQANYPAAAKKIATWLLQRFAERGNGVYQEFVNNAGVQNLGLGALDYSSLASRNVMKTLLVESLRSMPGDEQREVDSDGDGLVDTLDNGFTAKTNPFFADSDGDCFDDRFETLHASEGFIAGNNKDSRGCNPQSPLTLNCTCEDTDGDGLSQFAEDFVKTRRKTVDSDGDGIPDGLEVRYGLNAMKADAASIDTDGDGFSDWQELRSGSNPTKADRTFYDRYGYQYETTAEIQPDGRVCYQFAVANLQLVTPPVSAGTTQGYNLFKVYFAEAPESGVATDYGEWRTACAWAQFDPPGVRVPIGPELVLRESNFLQPPALRTEADFRTKCVGTR